MYYLDIQGLFKDYCHIQGLFKTVQTLLYAYCTLIRFMHFQTGYAKKKKHHDLKKNLAEML